MLGIRIATALAGAVITTAGLGTGGPARAAEAREHTIVIEGMQFKPAALTVRRGDRVVWRNKDIVPHTATAAQVFDSRTIEPGASWTYTAGKAGTLSYVCTFHPGMKGTLTVE
jgi:plastocyanin